MQGALHEYNYTPIMGVWSIVYIIAIVILGDTSLNYGAWISINVGDVDNHLFCL